MNCIGMLVYMKWYIVWCKSDYSMCTHGTTMQGMNKAWKVIGMYRFNTWVCYWNGMLYVYANVCGQ